MNVVATALPEVVIVEPRVYEDERGFFLETFHSERFAEAGWTQPFVLDCWSRSVAGTLRGLHYQQPRPQGKLVQVTRGAIFDVAVDIRRGSPRFGRWVAVELSEGDKRQLWIPPGFAHGFYALEDADVRYKMTDVQVPEASRGIAWDDPEIGIVWPLRSSPRLSAKDRAAARLSEAVELPVFGAD